MEHECSQPIHFYEMLIAHAQCRRHEVLREHTKGMAPYPLGTCDLKQFRSQFVTICSNCDSVDKTKPPIQSVSEFRCSLYCSDFKTSALPSLVKQNTLPVLWVSVRSSPLCGLH